MKYCLDSTRNLMFRKLEIVSLLVLELMALILLLEDVHGWRHLVTVCYLGLCFLTWVDAYILSRKYSVDQTGITVSYPFGYTMKYEWDKFVQIAVCRVHMKARSHKEKTAIRFTTSTESNGPHNAKYANEKWSSELYEILHWKSVLSIEYSEERYKEIASNCPNPILDYRYLKADYE